MPLETVGTTTCPECQQTVRVFRSSWAVPGHPLRISLHFVGPDYCPGRGRRVTPSLVTREETKP
jgi:hypothetical protein